MTVTEIIGGQGSWSITLTEQVPDSVLTQLGYFGHIAVIKGRLDPTLVGDSLRKPARYVGVLLGKKKTTRELSGTGMVRWLGDEDEKGPVIEFPISLTNATLAAWVTAVAPATIAVGTVNAQPNPADRYTATFQYMTRRKALQTVCDFFGVEFRVNGDATLDVGTQTQLYQPVPRTDGRPAPIIVRKGASSDVDLVPLAGELADDAGVLDYTTRAVLLAQTTDSGQIATGSATAPVVPYKDMRGNAVAITRMISESDQPAGTAAARAQLQLNRFNRISRALTVSSADYETEGSFAVGDMAYVYDPDSGVLDTTRQVLFQGRLIFPDVIRISGATWAVTEGHTVAFRTQDGVWIDLTPWVAWETGSGDLTIGDLPKSLTSATDSPIQMRVDATPDGVAPAAPTGLAASTFSYLDGKGRNVATVTPSWAAPTTNADGTPLTDLSHYLVQYRPTLRAPLWTGAVVSETTSIDITPLPVDLDYDLQVAAVDVSGNVGVFTSPITVHAAADSAAPNPPSDPVVTPYLGLLRVYWDGKDSTGNPMPSDFNRVEVHVSATSGFTPDLSAGSLTRLSSLATAGYAHVQAPYGSPRFVKLVAFDHTGNASSPSGQATGTPVQVAQGDVASVNVGSLVAGIMSADVTISGRFATALTGARVELNSLGLQKWDASNNLLVSLTGSDNLLVGVFKTALSGRRIELGSAGTSGQVNFFAPDGTLTFIRARTESTGIEAVQFGVAGSGGNVDSPNSLWNRINYNNDHGGYANYRANIQEILFGGPNNASGSDSAHPGRFHIIETISGYGTTSVERFLIDSDPSNGLVYSDANGTDRLVVTDTAHQVWDASGRERLSIDTGMAYWDASGHERFGISSTIGMWDQNQHQVLSVDGSSGGTRLYGTAPWNGNPTGYQGGNLELSAPPLQVDSVLVNLWTPTQTNGFIYGALLAYTQDSPGVNGRLVFQWWDGSAYLPLVGGAYTNASDRAFKSNVSDFADDALPHLRSLRPRTYRQRMHPHGAHVDTDGKTRRARTQLDEPAPLELGLVAQEIPNGLAPLLRRGHEGHYGVDTYALQVVTVKSVQELDGTVTEVVGDVAALRAEVKELRELVRGKSV